MGIGTQYNGGYEGRAEPMSGGAHDSARPPPPRIPPSLPHQISLWAGQVFELDRALWDQLPATAAAASGLPVIPIILVLDGPDLHAAFQNGDFIQARAGSQDIDSLGWTDREFSCLDTILDHKREGHSGRSDPGKAVQCSLPAASLCSSATDKDRFLLRGVNSPRSAGRFGERNRDRDIMSRQTVVTGSTGPKR